MKTATKRARKRAKLEKLPEQESTTDKAYVFALCKNPTMVRARLGDEIVIVKAPKRFVPRMLKKTIRVSISSDADGNKTYEFLKNE